MKYTLLFLILLSSPLRNPYTFAYAQTMKCEDDVDFKFKNNRKQSCNWIRQYEHRRQEHCSVHSEVRKACPNACGICCQDNDNYSFETTSTKQWNQSCKWLNEIGKDHRVGKYCNVYSNGQMVKSACQKSCGMCEKEVAVPTASPTVSEAPSYVPSSMPSTVTNQPSQFLHSENDMSRIISACIDSNVFKLDDGSTCGSIGLLDELRRANVCKRDNTSLACPQACGKCCDDDMVYNFPIPVMNARKGCKWISKLELRQTRFCETEQSGFRVSSKCPVACGICTEPSSSPSMESSLESESESSTKNAEKNCDDSPDFSANQHPRRTCDWIVSSNSWRERCPFKSTPLLQNCCRGQI